MQRIVVYAYAKALSWRHKQRDLDVADVMHHASSGEGVCTLGSLAPLVERRYGGLVVGVAEAVHVREARGIDHHKQSLSHRTLDVL